MRTGKLEENILKRAVLQQCKQETADLVQGAGIGADCALLRAEGKRLVSCAVHPAVLDEQRKVRYSLEHALNNLACSGCLPAFVLLTLLLPEETQEDLLKEIMAEAAAVCRKLQVVIAGGHTEVTSAVRQPILTVTACGFVEGEAGRPRAIQAGMDVLVAGTIAREGTALLAASAEAELSAHFSADFVREAKRLGESILIAREAACARESGVVALHDLSQGGVFGALWELLEGAGKGLEADLRKIPIRQETVEICEYFGKNPYCLLSGGALLIVSEDGEELARRMAEQGIIVSLIGKVTDGKRRVLHNGQELRFLDRPAQDEWLRRI